MVSIFAPANRAGGYPDVDQCWLCAIMEIAIFNLFVLLYPLFSLSVDLTSFLLPLLIFFG